MNYDNIPAELKALRQWVVWRKEQKDGRWTKVPYQSLTPFAEAANNNPSHWSTFDEACSATTVDGIGFVLTKSDPYCFIDLDDPKESDPELYEIHRKEQRKIAETFQSYQEISPGGGLHIICKASVLSGKRRSKQGVEIYSDGRYMTMTGNVYRNAPILDEQTFATALWTELGGENKDAAPVDVVSGPQRLEDGELYDRCANAKNGAFFVELWEGNWRLHFGDQSAADQALFNVMAFYSQNHEQLIRMFHRSALGKRDKAKRKDYLKWTLEKALDQAIEVLDFSQLIAHIQSVVMASRQADAEREQRRIDAVNKSLQEHYERNKQIAAQQIEQAKQDKANAPDAAYTTVDEFESPPGLLGEIAQFIYAQSPYPLPRTALTGAIAFLSAICGRAYNVNGVGCNLYLLLVAPTGVGKEAMASGISKLSLALAEIIPGSKSYFGLDQIASGQALYVAMKERKACLSIQGEFGIELQNLTHPRAPSPVKFLKKAYLDLFTKSGEGNTLGASAFADKTKNTESIQSPSLTILGETAPPHLYDVMNETMLADGLIPRFMLIECDSGSEKHNPWSHTIRPDANMMQRIATVMTSALKLDNANRAVHIKMDAEAQYVAEEYRAGTKRTVESFSRESGRQVWSRAHVKALKLAGLVAIGCNPFDPVITGPMFRWAISIVNDGTQRLMKRFEMGELGEGDARQTADMKKFILRYLKEGPHTLPKAMFNAEWHRARIIPYSYLRNNVIQMSSFRAAIGGASQGFMRTLKSLCDEGALKELDSGSATRLGTSGKLFTINDTSLFML